MAHSEKPILVNLLNFADGQLVGAGVFTKNILSEWLRSETRPVTIFHSASINPVSVFKIPDNKSVSYQPVKVSNFLFRILYEQFVLPFRLRNHSVYISTNPTFIFLAPLISPRTKIVITIHDMIPFFVQKKYGWLRTQYVKIISKYGARGAHEVITVSESSKKDICKIAGIAEDKVTVIYNFMPFSWTDYRNDENYFLSISTIEPGKNIEGTIKAFRIFLDKYKSLPHCFYWVGKIGWGYTAAQLNDLIKSYGLSERFFLLGFVTNDRKDELLKNCTALVYLSHYEGFGLPVLEGLLYNKPAVVTNVSSLPEVTGKAGVLCEPGDLDQVADGLFLLASEGETYKREIPTQLLKFDSGTQIAKFTALLLRLFAHS
jgi:glycosyltransferase involved in cell wall biosynthesis